MLAETAVQRAPQLLPPCDHIFQQVLRLDRAQHRQRRGARDGMVHIRMPVRQHARPGGDRVHHALARQHAGDRLVARAQPLRHGDDVGRDTLRRDREQGPGAAHATHHLVGDEQGAVAVANLADPCKIARRRRHATQGRAGHRLGHERGDGLGPQAEDFLLQLAGNPLPVLLQRFALTLVAVGVNRADMAHLHQQRGIQRPALHVAADGERAQRVAVIAHAPGDEAAAAGLAGLDEILPRQLERHLHRLGAAADEGDPAGPEPGRRPRDQMRRQLLRRVAAEEAAMRVRQTPDLLLHRRDHGGVGMAEAGDGGAARRIEVAPPLRVDQMNPLSARGAARRVVKVAMQDSAHRQNIRSMAKQSRRCYIRPASTLSRSPVIDADASLARNSAASATSSGSTQRRSAAFSV